jgi:integrase
VEGRRDPVTGKRRQYSRQVATAKEAKALEAEWTAEIERGTALNPSKVTVSDLLNEYVRIEVPKTVRPENRQPYESIINNHLRPAIGDVLVRSLTVEHVEAILANMQSAGYSSSTITKARMRLSSALQLGMRWNVVARDVAALAKPPKLSYKRAAIWSPDEVTRFLTEARKDHALWPFWLLLVESGARQSELLGLCWDDVDLDHDRIRLGCHTVRLFKGTPTLKDDGKSKAAGRTIGLTPATVSELRAYRATWNTRKLASGAGWNPDGLLFATTAGTPLSANNLRKSFDRLTAAAGVKAITPHSVRKTNVTLALAGGASPKAVAQRVGHADARVTLDVYASVTVGQEEHLVNIMAALTAGDRPEAQSS